MATENRRGGRTWGEKGGELVNRAATGYPARAVRETFDECYRA